MSWLGSLRGLKTKFEDEPRHGMPTLGVRSIAQLKCIYTKAHSLGNKQEELEAIASA